MLVISTVALSSLSHRPLPRGWSSVKDELPVLESLRMGGGPVPALVTVVKVTHPSLYSHQQLSL
jgi:hypothetical protein